MTPAAGRVDYGWAPLLLVIPEELGHTIALSLSISIYVCMYLSICISLCIHLSISISI